ncbi:MAG: helix-turn-helix domain-containing protein [Patescibacteria group bacterium]|jgi:cytoskeletal protein RodZ
MASFHSKVIANPPRLGEKLKACREKLNISLADAAKELKIAVKYLQFLEAGQYNKLPGEVYAKSFLRAYTKFLGLNSNEYLSAYKSEQKIYTKIKQFAKNDFTQPVKRISKIHLVVTPKIVRSGIVLILAVTCFLYLGLKVKAIMTPPELVINQPADNLVTEQNFIGINGKVEKESTLELNGQPILADQQGNFSETIDLQPGVNVIEVKAVSRHGKETKVYRQVVLNIKEGDTSLK